MHRYVFIIDRWGNKTGKMKVILKSTLMHFSTSSLFKVSAAFMLITTDKDFNMSPYIEKKKKKISELTYNSLTCLRTDFQFC